MSSRKPARSSSRRAGERGSATVELVVLLPALFTVMFLGMQAALYYHARTVAIAASQEGARAAASENGKESDGTRAAAKFVAAVGDSALMGAKTTAIRSATTATVTVRGFSLSVVPGWQPSVEQSASMPIEELTAP